MLNIFKISWVVNCSTAGDVVELPFDEGRSLVGYGKAEEYKGKEKKETNRSVGLEKSEKKVKKRAK